MNPEKSRRKVEPTAQGSILRTSYIPVTRILTHEQDDGAADNALPMADCQGTGSGEKGERGGAERVERGVEGR